MKTYNYSVGNAVLGPIKNVILISILGYVFVYFIIPKRYIIIVTIYLILFVCFLILLIYIYLYSSYKPKISGKIVINEKEGTIENYRLKGEHIKYILSDIEEIRYAREGLLYFKLKDNKSISLFFKISEEERKDFEKEMKRLSEKYGFRFLVLWKRRDVETGRKLSEIVKEDLERSSRGEK